MNYIMADIKDYLCICRSFLCVDFIWRKIMSGSVNSINGQESNRNNTQSGRPAQIVVKSGESLSVIAKRYGMNPKQFMEWTGLKKSSLTAGQKINLPTAQVPKGKGIMTLVRANGMTMEEFGRLNNLPKPYNNYKASAGETFYVFNHNAKTKSNSSTAGTPQTRSRKPVQKRQAPPPSQASGNRAKWGSSYSPEELAANIYQKSCDYWGAVGKPDFDALIKEINPKNVKEVIEAYTKNSKNKSKESLINTITSEVRSNKDKRKAAVMHIYDMLAKRYGTDKAVRDGFEEELNDQFDSWGMVNTKKLDETITRMMASPDVIAAKMEQDIDHRIAAVGKKSFNELKSLVTHENASEVIKAYDKLNTGESLIEGITSEIGSSKDSRKETVMHIYDALAKEKNIPESQRAVFEEELNKEFDSFGMVNTKELDKMINNMLLKPDGVSKTSPASNTSDSKVDNSPKVKFTANSEIKTAEQWRRGAIAAAKNEALNKYKEFCKQNGIKFNENNLDLTPMERIPAPVSKNGKVVADISPVLKPTTKPNGKVVILNPGHGGYSVKTGNFDPGSYSFIKKGNGKYAPLLEYEKMQDYAEKAAEKLQAEGYTVVIASGHAQTISAQGTVSNLVEDISSGRLTNKKYNKKDIVFVSLHADSEPGKSGSGICYDSSFKDDSKLAQTIQSSLNEDDWIKAGLSERVWGKNGLQVLHQSESNPSVLLEVEYVNGSKSQNLDSSAFQGRFLDKLTVGLNRYFGLD